MTNVGAVSGFRRIPGVEGNRQQQAWAATEHQGSAGREPHLAGHKQKNAGTQIRRPHRQSAGEPMPVQLSSQEVLLQGTWE